MVSINSRSSSQASVKTGKDVIVTESHDLPNRPSASRRSSLTGVWSSIKGYAREHHNSVNAAFEALYGNPATNGVQLPESRRSSSIKSYAREHHNSVNAAFEALYGTQQLERKA